MDQLCVGLVPDRHEVVRFAWDWLWQIGMGLFQDWWIGGELALNCLVGSGLTDWIVNGLVPEWCEVGSIGSIGLDWNRIGTELTSDWQSIGIRLAVDWHGLV